MSPLYTFPGKLGEVCTVNLRVVSAIVQTEISPVVGEPRYVVQFYIGSAFYPQSFVLCSTRLSALMEQYAVTVGAST